MKESERVRDLGFWKNGITDIVSALDGSLGETVL